MNADYSEFLDVFIWPGNSPIGIEIYSQLKFNDRIRLHSISSDANNSDYEKILHHYMPRIDSMEDVDVSKYLSEIFKPYPNFVIFPAHDLILDYFAFRDTQNLPYIGSEKETIALTRSKRRTYEFIENEFKFEVSPKRFNRNKPFFPVYVKPDSLYGGKGHSIVNDMQGVKNFSDEKFVLTEVLTGEEYTIECFTDSKKKLLFCNARIRNNVVIGTSFHLMPVDEDLQEEISNIADLLNQKIKFRGPWYFQLKRDSANQLKLLEISCRIPGSGIWSRLLGQPAAELAIFDFLNHNLKIIKNDFNFHVQRAINSFIPMKSLPKNFYLDLDGTILINNQLNPDAIKAIIKLKQNGRLITLITKSHKENLNLFLKDLGILNYFNSVFQINEDDEKVKYIVDLDGLFVDNSFNEREKVSRALKIPVFGPDFFELI